MAQKWFDIRLPQKTPLTRLYCFPFAGGNSSTYAEWPEKLSDVAEVVFVQLPGRGTRFRERPYTRIESLVDDLAAALDNSHSVPFSFFGHSMGSLIAFELARRLATSRCVEPALLFASGTEAPNLGLLQDPISDRSDEEIAQRLRNLKGMPEEVLGDPELFELLLPVIRADFEMTETYKFMLGGQLTSPIVAFCGTEDPEVTPELMQGWRGLTSGSFHLQTFPGDHFFLNSSRPQLLWHVRHAILQHLSGKATSNGM